MSDPRAVVTRIAEIGYGAVEPYDVLTDPTGFRALTDELGLRVSSAHAPVLGDQADAVLDAANTLGTDTVIVPHLDPARWADADGIASIAADLNAAAAKAASRGIRIGYHNHWFELEAKVDGKHGLEVLAEQLDPTVVLEVDTYWAQVGGADVPALLKRLGDRVRYLHVKDGPATNKDDAMTAVGGGVMPVGEILAANPAVEWHVVELDRCDTDMVQALADSYTYLTTAGVR
ncbi:MAG TPA: sugar phosphate isomerase/epimerase [Mycobacteriales bacterium]|nr:sugar phosphate isomerase/epimerase [Mycobacteriales bacterium]